jgi:hypothetical protein
MRWLRKLISRGGGSPAAHAPVSPGSCQVYLKFDRIVVVSQAMHETGAHVASEPVLLLPPDATHEAVGQAVLSSLSAEKPTAATLPADDFVSRTTGLKSWTALERGSALVSVLEESHGLVLTSMPVARDGGFQPGEQLTVAREPRAIGAAIERLAQKTVPRPPAKIRRPERYRPAHEESPDFPQPFGYKIWWLAVASADPRAVADALGLLDLRSVCWREGMEAAGREWRTTSFVTPSVEGWAFVLWPDGLEHEPQLRQTLQRLSAAFGEAQAYVNVRTSSCYGWARAEQGQLTRAFLYADGEVHFDIGTPTAEEVELDLDQIDVQKPPDEGDVLRVAAAWSINPCELGDQTPTTGAGWLGSRMRNRDA